MIISYYNFSCDLEIVKSESHIYICTFRNEEKKKERKKRKERSKEK